MEDPQSKNIYMLCLCVTQASMLAATAQAAEVSQLNQKLRLADAELDRVNKGFDKMQGMRHLYLPEVI